VAWDIIRIKLQDIVDKEDKREPLSDDDLVTELKKQGLNVARRTVTKYRQNGLGRLTKRGVDQAFCFIPASPRSLTRRTVLAKISASRADSACRAESAMERAGWFTWVSADDVTYTVRLADVIAIEERPQMGGSKVALRSSSLPLIEIARDDVIRLKGALGIEY
jgi:hypothetical protein